MYIYYERFKVLLRDEQSRNRYKFIVLHGNVIWISTILYIHFLPHGYLDILQYFVPKNGVCYVHLWCNFSSCTTTLLSFCVGSSSWSGCTSALRLPALFLYWHCNPELNFIYRRRQSGLGLRWTIRHPELRYKDGIPLKINPKRLKKPVHLKMFWYRTLTKYRVLLFKCLLS